MWMQKLFVKNIWSIKKNKFIFASQNKKAITQHATQKFTYRIKKLV